MLDPFSVIYLVIPGKSHDDVAKVRLNILFFFLLAEPILLFFLQPVPTNLEDVLQRVCL